jgi:holo-[acyl-carrier protein] synthase
MSGLKLSVGVDLVNIPELASMLQASGPNFIDSCWTTAEQAYCSGSVPRLAARWAAKEATMKALGQGIGDVDPIDIEVVAEEGQAPHLRLHRTAQRRAHQIGVDDLALSMSHESDLAIAFVVAYTNLDQQL